MSQYYTYYGFLLNQAKNGWCAIHDNNTPLLDKHFKKEKK